MRPIASFSAFFQRILDGHGHFAHRTDPDMVAAIIGDFITG